MGADLYLNPPPDPNRVVIVLPRRKALVLRALLNRYGWRLRRYDTVAKEILVQIKSQL